MAKRPALPAEIAAIADEFGDDPGGAAPSADLEATGPVWLWKSKDPSVPAAWHFMTITGEAAAALRVKSQSRKGGFGSVKVLARIGGTEWSTSVFPAKELDGFMLPLKASVRKAEGVKVGDEVTVVLRV
jgi:hypothetical protein